MEYYDLKREDVINLTDSPDKLSTTIICKTIRIGSHKFSPQSSVAFTSKGIRIIAPVVNIPTESRELHIQNREVVKIIAHFSKTSGSMLCFYTLRKCAQYIKTALNMEDNDASMDGLTYFSSSGPYQMRKIILEFDYISDASRNIIKSLWNFFDEISVTDAHDLLQRAADADRVQNANKTNEDNSAAGIKLGINEVRNIVQYPTGKGALAISTDDYMCLASDQYLNDIIIDFYLKWVHNNIVPEMLREKTFIFSTFFYKRLTTLSRNGSDREHKTAAQKRHARVQNWTKNVNLFEKDFIIIPINEQSHWFLAIICYPKLEGPVTFDTNVPVEPHQIKKQRGKKVALQIGNTTITPLVRKRTEATSNVLPEVCGVTDEDSERDEAEGDDSDLASEEDSSDFDNAAALAGNTTTINSAATTTTPTPTTTTSANTTNPIITTTPPIASTPSSSASNPNSSTNNSNVPASSTSSSSCQLPQSQAIKQPMILIFDSLPGTPRSRVVATLRDYLTCEHKLKMTDAPIHIFNKDNTPGHCVKVPQQNNFTDCGLFLLQYVEQFFKDPIIDYRIPIKQLNNWFDNLTVTRKREDISILLQTLMNEQRKGLKQIILPEIPFPTLNGQLVETPDNFNIEFEEEDMDVDGVDEDEDGSGVCPNEFELLDAQSSATALSAVALSEDVAKKPATIDTSTPIVVKPLVASIVSTTTTTTTTAAAVVPTQGRKKIVVKRRQPAAASINNCMTPTGSPAAGPGAVVVAADTTSSPTTTATILSATVNPSPATSSSPRTMGNMIKIRKIQ